jgi:hypothetical protein
MRFQRIEETRDHLRLNVRKRSRTELRVEAKDIHPLSEGDHLTEAISRTGNKEGWQYAPPQRTPSRPARNPTIKPDRWPLSLPVNLLRN